jgi:hypothetical protein
VISLILAPTVREQAGMKKLYLPPDAGLLRLRLKLEGGVEYKSYQVTLLTAEGAKIWIQLCCKPDKQAPLRPSICGCRLGLWRQAIMN